MLIYIFHELYIQHVMISATLSMHDIYKHNSNASKFYKSQYQQKLILALNTKVITALENFQLCSTWIGTKKVIKLQTVLLQPK